MRKPYTHFTLPMCQVTGILDSSAKKVGRGVIALYELKNVIGYGKIEVVNMEREFKLKHFIKGAVRFGDRVLHRQLTKVTGEPPTTPGLGFPVNRESIIRHHYHHLLKENLLSFGKVDGSVTIGDVALLIQNVTTDFPDADRFMGYPFSQITGDLQSALLTNPEARNATVNWLSGVREDTASRHQNLEQETKEWEEKLQQTDFEFRGLTTEAAREIKASENAIKLLGGNLDQLP